MPIVRADILVRARHYRNRAYETVKHRYDKGAVYEADTALGHGELE